MKIVFDTFFFIISDGISKLSKILLLPIYLLYLNVEIIGTIIIFETIIILTEPFFSLGLHYYVSRYYIENLEKKSSINILKNIISLKFVISILLLFFFLTVIFFFFKDKIVFGLNTHFLVIGLICSFLGSFSLIVQHKSIAEKTPKAFGKFNLISFTLSFCITTTIILFNGGVKEIFYGILCSTFLIFIISIKIILNKIDFSFIEFINYIKNIFNYQNRKMYRFSAAFVIHNFAILCLVFLDRIILSFYVSKSEIGIYSIGYQIGSLIPIFAVAFKNSYTSTFFEIAKNKERAIKMLNKVFISSLLLLLLFILFAITIINSPIISGSLLKYYKSIQIFHFVLPGMVLCFFYTMLEPIITYVQKTYQLSIIIIIAVVFNVIFNIMLVPRYGIVGAAISTDISYFMIFFTTLWLVYKYFGFPVIFKKI